jgi:Family of unknown function (DUF5996)
MDDFRARFIGKVSPVHFFWGSVDLAVTRFSGRTAPPGQSVTPNLASWVMAEAYSHEVSSCGFWRGNGGYGRATATCGPRWPCTGAGSGGPWAKIASRRSSSRRTSARFSSNWAKFKAKSSGWDENRTFLENDVLEIAVRKGRWVLTHVPADGRAATPV